MSAPTLSPVVRVEAQRILDRAARRILAERAQRPADVPSAAADSARRPDSRACP